ncbi:MAG: hypothetical protein IV100_12525 [Myxococcales bacterium]|uniref:hypothetical protein n=1 Tax=Sediminibacterium sp. TaxID=1917865 RepID=UPI001DE331A1|nr:hypothetical protein [Sediminibacterium sp.]MBT9485825.1 hypothetical protein [Sediminibacterium sp.]MBT9556851.1 hypothetical protein [Myxococcales bacterium]
MDITTKTPLASRTILTCLLAVVTAFVGYLTDGLTPTAALVAAGFAALAGYFRLGARGPVTLGVTTAWDLAPVVVLAELERVGSATVAELTASTGLDPSRVPHLVMLLESELLAARQSEARFVITPAGADILQLLRPAGFRTPTRSPT